MKRSVSILLALMLAVCISAAEEPKPVYEAVLMTDTYEDVNARYGEGITFGDYLNYGDALLAFYESGRLQAKGLYYEDIREVAAMTEGDFALVRDFKQGTELKELTAILGEGREIMCMNLADEDDAGQRRLYAWKDAEGNVLEALVELDDGEWLLFAIGEIR